MVALERQDVIGALVADLLGNAALAIHGIDRDGVAADIEQIEQGWNRRDLIGFFGHFLASASTRRESVAKALTMWIAAAPAAASALLHKVLPSMAMTSPDTRGSEAAQARKQAPNCSGSSAAHTREKVFLQGMPAEKGKYSRRKSSFSCPNITKSRQLSAPQIEPHSSTKRISSSGYSLVRSTCGSVQSADEHGWLSGEHFSVDGTLIQAWASHKSFVISKYEK